MKKLSLLAMLSISAGAFAQFFPENSLIVTRVNGTTSAAQSVDLVGFDYAGSANGQVFDLTTGGGITMSGSATSEGQMNGSAGFLALAGYSSAVATASVSGTTAVRRVAAFNNAGAGSVTYTDLPTGIYSGNNIRSAYTADGSTLLTAGTSTTNNGWRTTSGGTSTQLGTTTNTRVIKEVGGSIFGSTGSATGNAGIGIYSLNGGVETLVQGTSGTGTGTASPYDFEFLTDNGTNFTLVADDRSAANGGGVQVYQSGSLVKTFASTSLRSIGIRQWDDSGVKKTSIFGIANANTLVGLTFDAGTLASTTATFSTLATAGTGTVFRSVEVVPEPASMIAIGVGVAALLRRRKK